jgi:ankyrin repeat protein
MDLIHAAAQWGLQPMVAQLAQEEPALVNAANEFGWTCLMLACSRGHVGLAAWLLDHGARLEQGDADGLTALTHAACGRRGRWEAVALLLARGADPNAAGRWGSTALMEAASLGLVGRVRALLEGSPKEGPRALRLDARDAKGSTALFKVGVLEVVGVGIGSGTGSGARFVPSVLHCIAHSPPTNQPPNQPTHTHQACMYGRLEAVKVLLAAGADPTVPNHEGLSPMLATLGGRHRGKGRAITALLEVCICQSLWVGLD